MFVFYPLCMILGCIIGQYIVVSIYFFFKRILGKKIEYGILIKHDEKEKMIISDMIVPTLLATNFSLMLLSSFPETLIDLFLSDHYTIDDYFISMMGLFPITLIFTLIIAMAIYSPVWYLLESRIIYANKNKVKSIRDIRQIRSVSSWFQILINEYAGIGVVSSFIQFINEIMKRMQDLKIGDIVVWGIIIIYPILIMFFTLWVAIFLEKTKERRKKKNLN